MNIEHLSHWSGQLNREMYVNRYGHAGIPVVVFASSGGSHNEYYDFGMIDACARFIEEGRVQFFTLSSVDSESWLCDWKNPHDRAEMHRAYERYVIEEAIPFIKHKTGWFDPMMTTGCSMGAYHALNFFLQHPDVFNKVVALSGVYDARFFVGEFGGDEAIYQNSPSDYIWNQNDGWFIDRYSRVAVVRASALMGALGIGLIIFVDSAWVAGVSVVLWGLGASLGFPLTISAASDTGPDAPTRVSVVATTGYLAFLVGPPLLGYLGEHYGLRSAMMVVLALVILAAIVAKAVAKPDTKTQTAMENS